MLGYPNDGGSLSQRVVPILTIRLCRQGNRILLRESFEKVIVVPSCSLSLALNAGLRGTLLLEEVKRHVFENGMDRVLDTPVSTDGLKHPPGICGQARYVVPGLSRELVSHHSLTSHHHDGVELLPGSNILDVASCSWSDILQSFHGRNAAYGDGYDVEELMTLSLAYPRII